MGPAPIRVPRESPHIVNFASVLAIVAQGRLLSGDWRRSRSDLQLLQVLRNAGDLESIEGDRPPGKKRDEIDRKTVFYEESRDFLFSKRSVPHL